MKPKKRKPTHPGIYLHTIVFPAVDLTQQEISQRIGISRNTLSGILHGKLRLSPDVAARLGHLLGFDPAVLLRMQIDYDLCVVEEANDHFSWIEPLYQTAG